MAKVEHEMRIRFRNARRVAFQAIPGGKPARKAAFPFFLKEFQIAILDGRGRGGLSLRVCHGLQSFLPASPSPKPR